MNRYVDVVRAAAHIGRARLLTPLIWKRTMISECQRLGGVYIKFLQMVAVHMSTKDFVNDVSNRLAFEQVAYEPIGVRDEIRNSLGADALATIVNIADKPFAAGSYGQVYQARLKTGEEVIVKVLRPSVRHNLKHDLNMLRAVSKIISWFTATSIIDTKMLFREFEKATTLETDYRHEADAGEWLRDYFASSPSFYIPRTFTELSGGSVLVQEYVGGVSLASAMDEQKAGQDIEALVHGVTGSNIWNQLHTLGKEMLEATLKADFLMVDPHPGNVRLLSGDRVALIDFGLISPAPTNRGAFAGVIEQYLKLYEGRFDAGSFALASLAFYDPELHDALVFVARAEQRDYQGSLSAFITNRLAGDSMAQQYIRGRYMTYLFNDLINDGNNLGLHLAEENALVQRSMAMFLSMTRAIGELHDGEIHFRLIHAALSEVHEAAQRGGIERSAKASMSEERAYEVVSSWVEAVAERNQTLYKQVVQGGLA